MRNRKPVRVVGVIQNVTDRKRLEQQLLQSQKLESVGRLAGSIAHDFNNLLTIINGYAHLVLAEMGPRTPCATRWKSSPRPPCRPRA